MTQPNTSQQWTDESRWWVYRGCLPPLRFTVGRKCNAEYITVRVVANSRNLMPEDEPEMTAQDVIKVVQLFEQNEIDVYIDGGWGVDALLGKQTRTHADLDVAVQHKDIAQIRLLLGARGYQDMLCDDKRDCNFVLADNQGHQIDIHSYTFDSAGNHVYGIEYPCDSLTGNGLVNGYPVKCISPEWAVRFHTGYAFDKNDYHDVQALCQHFAIKMPLEYEEF